MVHDGDQNKNGGDVGQGCITASSACRAGFTGSNCSECDISPLPSDNTWSWYCIPVSAQNYQLIKVPKSKLNYPFYKDGFIPGPGVVDAQNYSITCDCKVITKPCPMSCCGNGYCTGQNGVCSCQIPQPFNPTTCCPIPLPAPAPLGPAPEPSPSSIGPQPSPPPLPCYNGGSFCSSVGICNQTTNTCKCIPGYSGPACEQKTLSPTPEVNCKSIANKTVGCMECLTTATYLGLNCYWCADPMNITKGFCSDYTTCNTNATLSFCTPPVVYKPEPCPNDCNANGKCVNGSAPGNGNGNNSPNNQTGLYCLCLPKYAGLNCGQVLLDDNLAIALGTSAAVIAGIVVGIALLFICFGGGGAFAYTRLAGDNTHHVISNNPIFADSGNAGNNPLNKE
jgi:hypothetical protein